MTKRMVSALLLIFMLSSFGVFAEETAMPEDTTNIARVVIDVSEPDEDDIITAKFTVYNTTYKGILAYLSYNKEAVTPVDYDTKEPTTEFARFAKRTTVAKNLETGADITGWCSDTGSKLDVENGSIGFVNSVAMNKNVPVPNSLITANKQILVNDEGLVVTEFYFKKISDVAMDLKPTSVKAVESGLMLINSNGILPYVYELKVPEGLGDSEIYYSSPEVQVQVTKQNIASAEEKDKLKFARTISVAILQLGNYATVSNNSLKWVDRDNKKLMPYIKDSRTMVPLRFISEEIGAIVSFDDDTQVISIKNSKTELKLTLGQKEFYNDGLKREMDVVPEVIDGRTFVPLRFISEALGRSVTWIETDQMIIVAPKDYPWDENNELEKELLKSALMLMSPMFRDFAY